MTRNCKSRARTAAAQPLLIWSALLLLCSKNLVPLTEAIWLSVPSTGTKCVSEEIRNNVVVIADYYVINEKVSQDATLSARVTSPYGNNLYQASNVTHGRFAFTSSEAGNYLACFWVDAHHVDAAISLSLDWKMGIGAKDWDSVAKKEKLEGVELDLRRLGASVEAIHSNLILLKDKEADMRAVSERTNSRVAWFSIMSLGLCIVVSVLQLLYLKRYFQKKKLI